MPLIIVSFLTCLLFDHFDKLNMALPTMNAIAMVVFLLVLKRNLVGHAWFWVIMTVFAALHVALVLFVPWTGKWVPALVIGGIGSLDIIAMLAILVVTGRALGDDAQTD